MTHAATKHDGEHLKEHATAVTDAIGNLAGEAGRYAGNRVSDARDMASAALDTVKDKASEYNGTLVKFIRKNPYKSLAIAAGIGLAAGFMLRRRS